MTPLFLTPSQMLFSQLNNTMDFQRFLLNLAPPWMTPRPYHIFYSGWNHHFRCHSKQKYSFIMTPSFWTPSQMSLTWLDSTMDFQRFCLNLAPPWVAPKNYHIICSGKNHHFRFHSKQIHSFVMIPSFLIPSQMLFSQLDSTMDCQRFCLSLAPPWMTLRPYHIFCYLLLFQLLQHAITSRYHDRSHFNSLPEAQLHGQSRPKKCCIFCTPCVIP